MEKLYIVTILLIFSGCASQTVSTPSQNKALNSISKSTAKTDEKGWIQKQVDSWKQKNVKNTSQNDTENTKKVYTKNTRASVSKEEKVSKEKSFTLQHFVDELGRYNEKNEDSTPSHAEQLKYLPVIGE